MASPLSARIAPELRQALARYCVDHDVTQTQAVEQGLRLLLEKPARRRPLTPEAAVERLKRIEKDLRKRLEGFDADRAKSEGRD
jgi:hypothetical protein